MTGEWIQESTVKNDYDFPLVTTVYDAYPLSGDPDITVRLREDATTPGYVKDPEGREGVICWTITINPHESKNFALAFRVRHPESRQMIGL
jgi:hypothetical protein